MANKTSMSRALQRAIVAVGGIKPMSELFGITAQAVWQWDVAPASRVIAIEDATKGLVSRHDLRPDIFGEKPAEVAA